MEFTFPTAMLHIYERYTCHGGEADHQFCGHVCMLPFFLYHCFKGKAGKFNYNSSLNFPSGEGTLVPPVYCTWRMFRTFPQRGAGVCRPQALCVCSGSHSNLTLLLTFLKLSRKEQLQSSNLEPHNSLTRYI